MSIERSQINVNGLPVQIVRKAIQNLHLGVYPPDGRVRVAVPLRVNNAAVRLAVIGKLGWIKKQRAKFAEQPRESRRELISGETHYFWGRRLRLRVTYNNTPPRIELRNRAFLEMYVRVGTTVAQHKRLLDHWYRGNLKAAIPPLIGKWQRALGVEVDSWGIKQMKTKWGSCNIEARRIWLNLELAKRTPQCLEYIIVHELTHLRERHHNDAFLAIMNRHLPNWRHLRQQLNSAPLAHATWSY